MKPATRASLSKCREFGVYKAASQPRLPTFFSTQFLYLLWARWCGRLIIQPNPIQQSNHFDPRTLRLISEPSAHREKTSFLLLLTPCGVKRTTTHDRHSIFARFVSRLSRHR